jgi:dTDP-4-amino-4,6-dideoxygalactose transaminase
MKDFIPKKIRKLCLAAALPVQQALYVLEKHHKEIVLVTAESGKILGTVTDGDIRRALLEGKTLETPIAEIMNKSPIVGSPEASRREWFDLMKRHRILQLPIVDADKHVVDLVLLSEVVQVDIPLADTHFGEREVDAIGSVLRSGWLSMGDITQQFEAKFAEFVGARHAIAVTNGTAALHLACAALGLGEGDEVLCPALSFVATSNAVVYTGAKPVFCEVRGDGDLTIDPDDIARRITAKTKAIVVMHYGGYACNMPAITQIANERGLYLIEDAAHAPGARSAGRYCGTWGDVGCFSFFANKNMTTGEGGMVTTNSDELAEKIRLMRSHGMTTLTLDRHRGRAYSYDVVELGYNYRVDEMRAALGLVQLESLAMWNDCRRQHVKRYRSLLADVAHVSVPFAATDEEDSACHIMPILLDSGLDRSRIMREMRERGVQTSIHYPAIHTFSYYRGRYPVVLPQTEDIASRQLTLPLYPTMTDEQIEGVVAALSHAVASEELAEHLLMRG